MNTNSIVARQALIMHIIRNFTILIFITLLAWSCTHSPNNQTERQTQAQQIDSGSIEFLNQKINSGIKKPELFVNRAKMHVEQGSYKAAIKDIEIAIKIDSLNCDNYLLLAEYQLLLGRSGKSKESLQKCLSIDPEHLQAMLNLAEIHLYVGQYNESMDWLIKAQKKNHNNARIYFIKSLIYKETGDTTKAIDNLYSTIEKDPGNYEGYMLLGQLYANKDDSMALSFFRNALHIMPNSIEAYYNIGMFYQNHNMPDKALTSYQKLLENADPEYLFALYNIGYLYLIFFKEYDNAINYFTQCIEQKSNYYQAFHNRGFAYEQQGHYDLARTDYKTAVNILPNYPLSVKALNRLDKIGQ